MAQVRLTSEGFGVQDLPPLCMVCGNSADLRQWRRFAWHPGWVYLLLLFGVLPWIIGAMFTSRTAHINAPLCTRHVNHWRKRTFFIVSGILGLLGILIAVIQYSNSGYFGLIRLTRVWFRECPRS